MTAVMIHMANSIVVESDRPIGHFALTLGGRRRRVGLDGGIRGTDSSSIAHATD